MNDLIKPESQMYDELNTLRHQLVLLRNRTDGQTQLEEKLRKTLQELKNCKEYIISQEKKLRSAREQVERLNKKYMDIFDFTPIGFLAFDYDGIIHEVNRTVTLMLGFKREYLFGNKIENFLTKESAEHFMSHLNNIFTKDAEEAIEVELICNSGKKLFALLDSLPIHDESGGVISCRTAIKDITVWKRSQQIISRGKMEWERTFDTVPDLIAILDDQYRIRRLNKAMADRLGLSFQEAIGLPYYRYVHGIESPSYLVPLTKKLVMGHEYKEEVHIERLGGDFLVSLSPLFHEDKTLLGCVYVARDITGRKKTEERIKKDYHIQSTINAILRISLEPILFETQLEHILELLLSVPGIAFQARGCIYLVEDDPEVLVMKAQRAFPQALINQCARVSFGQCLCGIAALRKSPVFVNTIDKDHETVLPEMDGHGHYCVPIMSGGKVLGIICVYVKEGHKWDKKEEEFLVAVAHSLAGLIERKKGQEALQRSKDELEVRVKERTAELIKAIEAREREISERKRAQKRIKESLAEKEVLLSEIHHRVKNNMQIISSMLELQAEYITNHKYLNLFKDTQNRIQSMALIHEKLYQSRDLAHINFKDYVQSLTDSLIRSYRIRNSVIKIKFDIEDICLNIDAAITCGLIINELIANSLQHAFPDERPGQLMVSLCLKGDDMIELTVGDNGIGISNTVDYRNTETLGLQLVTNLTTYQLKGKVERLSGKGTVFKISFKRTHYVKRV